MKTAEMRHQIKEYAEQLSPRNIRAAYDFLAYLADKESEEATEELLAIPGFLEAVEKAEKEIAEGKFTEWRKVRSDV